MPFRLRRDTRDWFRDISSHFKVDFDMYYLCLLAGFAARHKVAVPIDQTTELVDDFPGPYKSKSRLIVATYLTFELEDLGISFDDRQQVREAVRGFLDPNTPSKLSSQGMEGMNRYSWGGYEVLQEWFDERPRAIETFLSKFFRMYEDRMAR